jgi:uncharacterized protein
MMVFRVEHNRRRLRMHVVVCRRVHERARGLLLRPRPDERTAWLLQPCAAIHTLGLWYSIDVVFCAPDGRILRVDPAVPPFRIRRCHGARHVWELAGGGAERLGWRPGDRVLPC